MTAYVSGGTVKFVRPSNYNEGRSGAEVTLTFSMPEGAPHADASAMLDAVSHMAMNKAREMVGEKPVPTAPAVSQPTTAAPPPIAPVAPVAPTPDPTLIGAPAPVTPALTPISPSPALIGGGSPAADPTLIGAPAAPGPASPALISTAPASAPAEVTDAQMVAAVTTANSRLFGRAQTDEQKQLVPVELHRVIAAHMDEGTQPPFKVQMVPQHRRAACVAALNAL